MALSIKIKNKRRWQEIGVAIVLTVLMAMPTAVMVAYIPDVVREWQLIYQQYGPGRAYTLIGIFAAFTLLFTGIAIPVVWHYRGGVDWVLGKPSDDHQAEREAQ